MASQYDTINGGLPLVMDLTGWDRVKLDNNSTHLRTKCIWLPQNTSRMSRS